MPLSDEIQLKLKSQFVDTGLIAIYLADDLVESQDLGLLEDFKKLEGEELDKNEVLSNIKGIAREYKQYGEFYIYHSNGRTDKTELAKALAELFDSETAQVA